MALPSLLRKHKQNGCYVDVTQRRIFIRFFSLPTQTCQFHPMSNQQTPFECCPRGVPLLVAVSPGTLAMTIRRTLFLIVARLVLSLLLQLCGPTQLSVTSASAQGVVVSFGSDLTASVPLMNSVGACARNSSHRSGLTMRQLQNGISYLRPCTPRH